MKPKTALVKNVLALRRAYEFLAQQKAGMEIALIHGLTGYGKTSAIRWLIGGKNALYLEASPNLSSLSLLEDICFELGFDPGGKSTRQLERLAISKLQETGRGIFLDEFDRILNSPNSRRLIETLRMIHDQAGVPLLLIGEDRAELRLAKHPQFERRCSQRIRFLPLDLEDCRILAEECFDKVQFGDAFLSALVTATGGSMAFCAMNLREAEALALSKGWGNLDLTQWEQVDRGFISPNQKGGLKR